MKKEFYDLTLEIHNDSTIFPGDPKVNLTAFQSIKHGDVCNITNLNLGSHTGTHIDAPKHFYDEGKTIDLIPFTSLIGKVKLFDLSYVNNNKICREDLDKLDIEENDIVFIKTTNSQLYNELKFSKEYVYLDSSAAKYLAKKKIATLGFDYFSVEKYDADISEVHYILLKENVVIIEGLDLRAVTEGYYDVYALPLRLKNIDGSPVRVIISR